MFDFRDKIVVVSGGARGIGKCIREQFEAAGAVVCVIDLLENDFFVGDLADKVKAYGSAKLCEECSIGAPTLHDIVSELQKPGRDIRDSFTPPALRDDVLSIEDLKPDMVLNGTVRNVIDFGAFVDIGVHQDGLVHISALSNRFVKHPSEVVSVGDQVKVRVLAVDVKKKRISLSMKNIK